MVEATSHGSWFLSPVSRRLGNMDPQGSAHNQSRYLACHSSPLSVTKGLTFHDVVLTKTMTYQWTWVWTPFQRRAVAAMKQQSAVKLVESVEADPFGWQDEAACYPEV